MSVEATYVFYFHFSLQLRYQPALIGFEKRDIFSALFYFYRLSVISFAEIQKPSSCCQSVYLRLSICTLCSIWNSLNCDCTISIEHLDWDWKFFVNVKLFIFLAEFFLSYSRLVLFSVEMFGFTKTRWRNWLPD